MRKLLLAVVLLAVGPVFADPPPYPRVERAIVTPIYPVFPEAARARGVRNATVVLELQVGPNGIVQDLHVVTSGGAEFDDAAMVVGRLTVFAPAKTITLQRFKVTFDLR
jgi:TonB family protein